MRYRLIFSIALLRKKILQILLGGVFCLTEGGGLSILLSIIFNDIKYQ